MGGEAGHTVIWEVKQDRTHCDLGGEAGHSVIWEVKQDTL